MHDPLVAVLIPVGPGHERCAKEAEASAHDALLFGGFTGVVLPMTDDGSGRSATRNALVSLASRCRAEWVFFLDADDVLMEDTISIFHSLMFDNPGVDAFFGSICSDDGNGGGPRIREDQSPSGLSSFREFLFTHPFLAVQIGHFVRTDVALELPFRTDMDCGEDYEYYLRLWRRYNVRKVTRPFFVNRRGNHSSGPRAATGADWSRVVYGLWEEARREFLP